MCLRSCKEFEIHRCHNFDVKLKGNQHIITLFKVSDILLGRVVSSPLHRPVGPSTPFLESLEDAHT
jgi:hypothetical protein